jgi:hypothetical protein
MPYTSDELWQQAISSTRARVIRGGDLETTVEFYGVYIIKSGLGYEYKTSHSGGEYYDRLSIPMVDLLHILGYEDGIVEVAIELLSKKLLRYENYLKPNNQLITKLKEKLCEVNKMQKS